MNKRGLFPLVISLLSINLASHAQTYIFGRADLLVGSSGAYSVATGDFNGDGIIDLVSVNQPFNTVSILLGKPDGGFSPEVTYFTGSVPMFVVVGDFNGDGNLDLAVANWNCAGNEDDTSISCGAGTVGILLGNGDGSFQPPDEYATGTGPSSIGVADFNGDGKLDLAIKNQADSTVSVLLGNGDGTFQPQIVYATAAQSPPSPYNSPDSGALVIGDFNGDHKPDLAVACDQTISVLLGNGDGTFRKHVDSGAGGAALAAADFNGDGNLDLAVNGGNAVAGGATSVLLGKGDGTFVLSATYASGFAVAAADLNGDGKPDLVISGSAVAVLLGNGNGTFQTAAQYTPPSTYVAIADLNGDGKLDLAVVNGPEGLFSVLLGFGDGTFEGATNYPFQSSTLASQMLSADFNGDGKADLVAETAFPPNNGPTPLSVYLGNGDGTFQAEVTTSLTQSAGAIAVGDFNGDGKADLVTVFPNCVTAPGCPPGQAVVLIGNGDGTFQPPVEYTVGQEPGEVAVGDFNGDGKPDIAVLNTNAPTNGASAYNTVSILINNGDGTFKPHVDYLLGIEYGAMALGDFKGNGILDIAFANGNQTLLLGNGDGTFTAGAPLPIGVNSDSIVAADFNGDGKLDLALSDGDNLYILLGNGDGTFKKPVTYPNFDGGGSGLSVADFNSDGKLDLILGGVCPFEGEISLGNGDGSFQPPIFNFFSCGPFAVADFNQDGALDVAAGGDSPGAVTVMSSAAFKQISPASLNFGSQGVATTSLPRTTLISNPSNVRINIASIVASGNFSQTNDCGASLAPGAHCSITVNFIPTTAGARSGAITITDSTRISPLAIPLSGAGVNGPFLTPFPGRTNFATPQAVGTSSQPSAIMLVNTGNASLNLSGISITGVDNSDFTQTNNCGSSLSVAGSCIVNVTFAPKAGGSRTASVSIADNAPGSPQSASLSGTGADFMVGPTSGSSTSQTINAGESAKFSLVVASLAGFSGTVKLDCNISPPVTPAPTCSLSTSSVGIGAGASQTVTVTVGTTAPVTTGTMSEIGFPLGWLPLAWTGMLISVDLLTRNRKRLPILAVLALASCAGCGGGGGSSSSRTTPGTPAGTYTATITATSGSSSYKTSLTVIVQ